jgi:putative transposase
MNEPRVSYKRHRFPPAVIARPLWLYIRFPLGLRLVEMLLERRIVVSYETLRNGPVLCEKVRLEFMASCKADIV